MRYLSISVSLLCIWLMLALVACAAQGKATTAYPTITPTVSATPTTTIVSEIAPTAQTINCGDVDANWGKDWPSVISALEQLMLAGQPCWEEPLSGKKYAAHFSYAAILEKQGDLEQAIHHYREALLLDPYRSAALEALVRLDALPEPTPPPCLSASDPRPDPALEATPDPGSLVTVDGDQLSLGEQVFTVKGVNYYPRTAPWHRFIEQVNVADMAAELDLIHQAGFNTIRVFLWYSPLFTCQPDDATPNEEAFATIDALFELAHDRDLKLIVTLNDLPDLHFRPLYTDWAHYDAQTAYIVRRYRHKPEILAWDLRNEGDLDYGARSREEAIFSQEQVMTWLAHISELVRENDPFHLLTAGWWGDPTATSPYVDFLSFHHWYDAEHLQARITDYRARSTQPLMLQEVGYHSWGAAPVEHRSEQSQADILQSVTMVAEETRISGWVIWTAFDFVPKPGEPPTYEHFFGIWRTDLTPKPALDVLTLQQTEK